MSTLPPPGPPGPSGPEAPESPGTGARLVLALREGLRSQFQPAMLGLLLVPFVVAGLLWVGLAWWGWEPAVDLVRSRLFESTAVMRGLIDWLSAHGVGSADEILIAVLLILVLIPVGFASAMLLISVLAMPVVLHRLGAQTYPDVQARGRWSLAASLGNAVLAIVVFLIGYLLTMPLWLVPGLGFVVPWFWWSWLAARMLRLDSLVEYADQAERRLLIGRHRWEFLLLGLAVTALNYVPPLFLITPVLSALVFAHFSFRRLRELRGRPLSLDRA